MGTGEAEAADREFDADVVIVGYGPTGVSMANFLGAYGVSAISQQLQDSLCGALAGKVQSGEWSIIAELAVGNRTPVDLCVRLGLGRWPAGRLIESRPTLGSQLTKHF